MNSLKQIMRIFSQKKNIILLTKIGLTVLILYFILRKVPIEAYKQAYLALTTKTLLSLLFLVIFQIFVLAYRWNYLIFLTTSKKIPLTDVIIGTFISFFVSQGLVASIGADAFKIWWMKKRNVLTQSGLKITLMDRIYGLVSLMILCVLSVLLFFVFVGRGHSQIMSLSLVIIFVGLILCLFFVPFKIKQIASLSKSKKFLPSLLSKFLLFGEELRNSLNQQRLISSLFLISLSFLAHCIVILQAYIIGNIVNPSHITFLICVLAIPPAIFVSYMPFSIAGWGVREASMVMAFGLVGVSSASAFIISITIGMAVFIASLIGGIFWVFTLKNKAALVINANDKTDL